MIDTLNFHLDLKEMDKTTWMQHAKDWTQLLAQFALGVAAIQVLGN